MPGSGRDGCGVRARRAGRRAGRRRTPRPASAAPRGRGRRRGRAREHMVDVRPHEQADREEAAGDHVAVRGWPPPSPRRRGTTAGRTARRTRSSRRGRRRRCPGRTRDRASGPRRRGRPAPVPERITAVGARPPRLTWRSCVAGSSAESRSVNSASSGVGERRLKSSDRSDPRPIDDTSTALGQRLVERGRPAAPS